MRFLFLLVLAVALLSTTAAWASGSTMPAPDKKGAPSASLKKDGSTYEFHFHFDGSGNRRTTRRQHSQPSVSPATTRSQEDSQNKNISRLDSNQQEMGAAINQLAANDTSQNQAIAAGQQKDQQQDNQIQANEKKLEENIMPMWAIILGLVLLFLLVAGTITFMWIRASIAGKAAAAATPPPTTPGDPPLNPPLLPVDLNLDGIKEVNPDEVIKANFALDYRNDRLRGVRLSLRPGSAPAESASDRSGGGNVINNSIFLNGAKSLGDALRGDAPEPEAPPQTS